jgi:HSP20 family protein
MMDLEKMKQWMELAQKVQGGDFWNQVFEQGPGGQFGESAAFNSFAGEPGEAGYRKSAEFPLVDIYETETQIILLAGLPGIQREDVQLFLQGDRLIIRGTIYVPYSGIKNIQKERFHGNFERAVKLPAIPNDNKLSAKFINGLLEISYGKITQPEEQIPIE